MITLNNHRPSLTRKFICLAMAMVMLCAMISATTVFADTAPTTTEAVTDSSEPAVTDKAENAQPEDDEGTASAGEAILNFLKQTGFYELFAGGNWKCVVMILISFVLMFLAIVKKFEPLLI